MSMAVLWLIAAVVLGVIEGMTVALVSVWMAVGAFVAAVAAYFGAAVSVQVLVFASVSVLLLAVTAPLGKKMRVGKKAVTNADRLIGAVGVVLERIDVIEKRGTVKVMGQVWSASATDSADIDIGEKVIVETIEGVHLVVKKLEQ